jgi:hypothetical protein
MYNIDISNHIDYNFTRQINLDNYSFILIFNYNEKFDFWTLKIKDSLENSLIITKIVYNFDFLSRYKSEFMPAGRLIFFCEDKSKSHPLKDDFKNKIGFLKYIDLFELNNMQF